MKNGVTKSARRFYASREESVTTDFSVFVPQLGAECVPNRFILYGTPFCARVTSLLQDQSGSKDRTKAQERKNAHLVSPAVDALVFGLMHVNASSPKPLPAP